MSWWPGWDSITGSHWWSNAYFFASIVSLILLGVFEVVSHRYSERKDELTAIEQADTQRRHDEEMTRIHQDAARLTAEAEASRAQIAEAHARAAEANQKAEEERLARIKIEERLAPRGVPPERFPVLVTALSPFAGTTIGIWQAGEFPETGGVTQIALAALQGARWDVNVWVWTGIGPVIGMAVFVRPDSDNRLIESANGLAAAFSAAGLPCSRQDWPANTPWNSVGGMHIGPMNPGPTDALIRMIIGAKPAQ